jgi:ATP-dependent helicase HrpB
LVLDLAQWGVTDPAQLAFLDAPPKVALTEAQALLRDLGAVDAAGRITEEGKRLRRLPLPPRLARMVVAAAAEGFAETAASVAAILSERGLGGDDVDLAHRLDALRRDRSRRAQEARQMAKRWAEMASQASRSSDGALSPGTLLALAYPDRIAKNRGGGAGAFLLANGRGGTVDPASPLAREPYLAVAELTGTAIRARIVLAAAISLEEIEARFAGSIEHKDEVVFDAASGSLRGRRSQRLGAIALADAPQPVTPGEGNARLLAEGVARAGFDRLPWTKGISQRRSRVIFLRTSEGAEWPDLSDSALALSASEWLAPALSGKTAIAQLTSEEFAAAFEALLPWPLRRRLDAEAPTHFEAPSGSRVAIDYDNAEGPKVAVRVQELFGLDRHPAIAGGRVPLIVELLSPAHRPVQVTRDLPGFWRGSYAAVRTEMRGRYPRHPWPDNPLLAPATRRAKPRGT